MLKTFSTNSRCLVANEKLKKEDGAKKADTRIYRSLVGSLLYLTATRPDRMFAAKKEREKIFIR